jgi:hypothetical protein
MKKSTLSGIVASLLFAGCSTTKEFKDSKLLFDIYGTRNSSSHRLSHSIWAETSNSGITIDSPSGYDIVFLAYAKDLDKFIYLDLPQNQSDKFKSIEELSLFIGKKNRTWQADIKYVLKPSDSNVALVEFVDFYGNSGKLTLDFDENTYFLNYGSHQKKNSLDLLYSDFDFFNNSP